MKNERKNNIKIVATNNPNEKSSFKCDFGFYNDRTIQKT